jgi:hypothetical protein
LDIYKTEQLVRAAGGARSVRQERRTRSTGRRRPAAAGRTRRRTAPAGRPAGAIAAVPGERPEAGARRFARSTG